MRVMRHKKPLPFRGEVGVGSVGKGSLSFTNSTPYPSPEGERR
jgi:hypothetical protein